MLKRLLLTVAFAAVAFAAFPEDSNRLVPAGPEFQVNTYTSGFALLPNVEAFDTGFVVSWQGTGSPGTDPDSNVQARRFAADGTPIGDQFQVNTTTTGGQGFQRLVTWPDGRALVVWRDFNLEELRGQFYAADGSSSGSEFQLNDAAVPPSGTHDLAVVEDGTFVLVWDTEDSPGDDLDAALVGRRFDDQGAAIGGEFQVNGVTSGVQRTASVRARPDSGFAVTWVSESSGGDATENSVQFKRFASDGSPVGADLQVNSSTGSPAQRPVLAVAADDSFLVTWNFADPMTSDLTAFARRFDSAGAAVGADFQVSPAGQTNAQATDAAATPGGGFLIAWFYDFDEASAARYAADGTPIGSPFPLNSITSGPQQVPTVAYDRSGNFIAAWFSDENGGLPSDNKIRARRFLAEADLGVTVSDGGVDEATPGGTIGYTVEVSNAGPDAAAGVRVEDADLADLDCTWTATPAGGASGQTANGVGRLLDTDVVLPVGATVTYDVDCTIDPLAEGTLTQTVQVSREGVDPQPANDMASDDAALMRQADVALEFSEANYGVSAGGVVEVTIRVSNAGPSATGGGQAAIFFPSGVNFADSEDCVLLPPDDIQPARIGCDFSVAAPSVVQEFSFRLAVDIDAGSPLSLTGVASSLEEDPDFANNSAATEIVVEPPLFADGFESGDTSAWSAQVGPS
ncbi:MAG: hypothetical protein AAGM22_24450 [Acidobacteriota bacterium]